MLSARPYAVLRVDQNGFSLVEANPDVSPEDVRRLIPEPSWVEGQAILRRTLITALAGYVESTNNTLITKAGRTRAYYAAVMINQLTDHDNLNDLQLAMRLVRNMQIEDNRESKSHSPIFGSSKDMRAAVMEKICNYLDISSDELNREAADHYAAQMNYVRSAAQYGGGSHLVAAMPDRKASRHKTAMTLIANKMSEKRDALDVDQQPQSLFVQDLLKTIDQYQQSTRYQGCCLYGRVKAWKKTGYQRADKFKQLISDMANIEKLSDAQIRTELSEYANFKKHIGLFDSSKNLRGMLLRALNNEPRQEDRIDCEL